MHAASWLNGRPEQRHGAADKNTRTHLQEGDQAVEAGLQAVHAQGQGGHKHAALQGLQGGDGATHEAAKLAQQLGVDVANRKGLSPGHQQGEGERGQQAEVVSEDAKEVLL